MSEAGVTEARVKTARASVQEQMPPEATLMAN
jgi:hypothetical protein